MTESDALEVVQLLQESLLDAYTDELGRIDTGRKGGISLAKQVHLSFKSFSYYPFLKIIMTVYYVRVEVRVYSHCLLVWTACIVHLYYYYPSIYCIYLSITLSICYVYF